MIRLSRVMPALLMRMAIGPSDTSTPATSAPRAVSFPGRRRGPLRGPRPSGLYEISAQTRSAASALRT